MSQKDRLAFPNSPDVYVERDDERKQRAEKRKRDREKERRRQARGTYELQEDMKEFEWLRQEFGI